MEQIYEQSNLFGCTKVQTKRGELGGIYTNPFAPHNTPCLRDCPEEEQPTCLE